MRLLLVGSGGREHALAWSLAASPLVSHLAAAPGNPGIAALAACHPVAATDLDGLVALARRERIDVVIVGPEAPLVAGLVDRLAEVGIRAFGPTAAAAQLEGSKGFTKDLCAEAGIPTAPYRRFAAGDGAAARAHVAAHPLPVVLKQDGLAAGKGVVIATTHAEAFAALAAFGDGPLVVEGFLDGREVSVFALCDGTHALLLPSAQDHKRAFDGDRGPNTGGMGAYSPAPLLTPDLETQVRDRILGPTLRTMAARGTPFRGLLYAGLMVVDGAPYLLEYNARFGDPECQALLVRLRSDLLPALLATTEPGALAAFDLRWDPRPSVCVVVAARGYPESPVPGGALQGLAAAEADPDVQVFHAGTRRAEDGRLVASGGRVLSVVALGEDLAAARARAYAAVARIDYPDAQVRTDIAARV